MVKQRTFLLALTAAALMLLIGSVAFADGPTTTETVPIAPAVQQAKPVCIDGYVINHREQPVDGTKTNPPLVVQATGTGGTFTDAVDKNGYFSFTNLAAGSYNIQLQLPAGWDGLVPVVGEGGLAETGPTQFDFVSSKKCYRIVFKIRRLVTIPVLKWEERLDGTVVPGEGWAITATPQGDPFARVVTATITSGQGLLTLTPGTWSVAETVKSGWVPVTPPTVTRVVDQYQTNSVVNPIVFKNREPKCYPKITVTKVGYGTNADGEREALGTIAGFKFTVARADKTWPGITKTTQGDGRAVFDKLWPGVYKVTETVPSGWKVLGDNPVTVVLMDCEEVEVTFEDQELIGQLKITGQKLFKAWEKPYKGTLVGIPGWTITATLVGTDTSITTVTDALGKYEFTADALKAAGMGFPGASIKVCEEKRDHWINVTADCMTFKFPYPVPADYKGAVVNFTNVQDPPVVGAPAASAPVAISGACATYHTVVRGDTVAKIAGRYGASASSIVRANNIRNADLIYLGQTLCVPN